MVITTAAGKSLRIGIFMCNDALLRGSYASGSRLSSVKLDLQDVWNACVTIFLHSVLPLPLGPDHKLEALSLDIVDVDALLMIGFAVEQSAHGVLYHCIGGVNHHPIDRQCQHRAHRRPARCSSRRWSAFEAFLDESLLQEEGALCPCLLHVYLEIKLC